MCCPRILAFQCRVVQIAIILGMITIVYIFYDIIFSGIYLRARGETYGL
ncbi:TPA: hypothetical protein NJU89_002957 [Clostridium perfringens]|nr:hypothetical protein [Clostridium perfringens]HCG3026043.1 hypothetical protein [Clostridium perfringens]